VRLPWKIFTPHKEIKRQAATISDPELKNFFMKSYVKIAEEAGRLKSRRGREDGAAKADSNA
jgi:hypothetical protein